jgi:hypothetical protein
MSRAWHFCAIATTYRTRRRLLRRLSLVICSRLQFANSSNEIERGIRNPLVTMTCLTPNSRERTNLVEAKEAF